MLPTAFNVPVDALFLSTLLSEFESNQGNGRAKSESGRLYHVRYYLVGTGTIDAKIIYRFLTIYYIGLLSALRTRIRLRTLIFTL
jgi:hypothetical protein